MNRDDHYRAGVSLVARAEQDAKQLQVDRLRARSLATSAEIPGTC